MYIKFTIKMILSLYLITTLFVITTTGNENNVKQAFTSNEITPDVLSKPPENLLKIKYKTKEVTLGNEIAPKDVRQIPTVTYDTEPNSYYTLIMSDPDAPSRQNPIRREWQHWLVVNIPGSDVAKGETLAEYVGSGPPKNTGLHRYVFLLYKQPEKLKFDETFRSNRDGNRGKFSAEKFAKKYNLGDAIAGNFFQAQFDDSVPDLHKQFQKK